jgi:hypothetical protein
MQSGLRQQQQQQQQQSLQAAAHLQCDLERYPSSTLEAWKRLVMMIYSWLLLIGTSDGSPVDQLAEADQETQPPVK